MQNVHEHRDICWAYTQCGDWPASRMTRNTSSVVRSKIGSQSNHSLPARELRSLRTQGMRLDRALLSSRRIPMALTMRPAKRGEPS